MLSLSDLLLRLPGLVYPDVGLTDRTPSSDSPATSGLAEYLLISDALDLSSQKKIYHTVECWVLEIKCLIFGNSRFFKLKAAPLDLLLYIGLLCSNKKHYCKPDVTWWNLHSFELLIFQTNFAILHFPYRLVLIRHTKRWGEETHARAEKHGDPRIKGDSRLRLNNKRLVPDPEWMNHALPSQCILWLANVWSIGNKLSSCYV